MNDDPRSVDPGDGPGTVLHAKAVVQDNEQAVVTSANLTPNALDRNIEAGLLVRGRTLAQALASHSQRLIDVDAGVPVPLPPPRDDLHTMNHHQGTERPTISYTLDGTLLTAR